MATVGGRYTGPLTLGGRINYGFAPSPYGVIPPDFARHDSIKATPKTIGGSIEGGIAKALNKLGMSERRAAQYGQKIMAPLNDVTPVGNVTGAEEGGKQFLGGLSHGDLRSMALGAGIFGLSVVPGAAGTAAKKVGKGMFGRMMRDTSGAIRAWHGSPHDFDRFDMSKIGTGEGAQAYGHGLYFAENRKTGEAYRDALGYRGTTIDGVPITNQSPDEHYWAGRALTAHDGGDIEKAISFLNTRSPTDAGAHKAIQQAKALLESGRVKPLNTGHLYEVNINANPDDFLAWDKPLLEQNEKIQRAFAPAFPGGKPPYKGLEGAMAYRGLQYHGVPLGENLPAGKEEQMVADLRNAGIPGIRYPDQGSRNNFGAGGTFNYTIFDDSLIDILNKF